jgi:hypothetical protein
MAHCLTQKGPFSQIILTEVQPMPAKTRFVRPKKATYFVSDTTTKVATKIFEKTPENSYVIKTANFRNLLVFFCKFPALMEVMEIIYFFKGNGLRSTLSGPKRPLSAILRPFFTVLAITRATPPPLRMLKMITFYLRHDHLITYKTALFYF